MITVEQLDIDEFDLVVDLVERLLNELREEENATDSPDVENIRRELFVAFATGYRNSKIEYVARSK